jgi:hypothetical protein
MTGIRKLHKADLMQIRLNIVESDSRGTIITEGLAEHAEMQGNAFTYFKDDKPVGCCGAILHNNVWNMWAIYSNEFSVITIARATVAFCKKFRSLLPGCRGVFSIPSDLCNGARYAKFIGGVYKKTVSSEMFPGITNDIYEVANGY